MAIICHCNNIRDSQFKDKKITKERLEKIKKRSLKCKTCIESWEKKVK